MLRAQVMALIAQPAQASSTMNSRMLIAVVALHVLVDSTFKKLTWQERHRAVFAQRVRTSSRNAYRQEPDLEPSGGAARHRRRNTCARPCQLATPLRSRLRRAAAGTNKGISRRLMSFTVAISDGEHGKSRLFVKIAIADVRPASP